MLLSYGGFTMIYVCKTEHIKTGKTHVFKTAYDYQLVISEEV